MEGRTEKGKRIIESLIALSIYCVMEKMDIRVWREELEVKDHYFNQDLIDLVYSRKDWTRSELAEALAAMPRVNAVEVKYAQTENAVLIYPEWP